MFPTDNATSAGSRSLSRTGSELVPPSSGHRAERPAGAAPATAPPGLCPVGGSHDPFSVKFFARRKVFQRNPCECLKGGEMTAEAESQGCLLSSEKEGP